MARLALSGVTKRFGATAAVDGVDLDVAEGEFLALLGPSGCGKTTLLRLVAGLEEVDGGTIALGDRTVSAPGRHLPAEDRRIGIVFQSYALWPHMSVARNVGYALEVAGIDGAAYRERVAAALATVGLAGFAERRPGSLSGGQRQRVALARVLAMEPAVVLLDEPLANLDVHLRAAMMEEFAGFHASARATMVYVTHDQAEAMALADRVAVMDQGRVVQVAPPRTLYREPATAMVARFVGGGATVPGTVLAPPRDGQAEVALLGLRARLRCRADQEPGPAQVCLRPRDLSLATAAADAVAATITRTLYRGGDVEAVAVPTASPDTALRLVLDDPAPAPGTAVHLRLRDGWVVPAAS